VATAKKATTKRRAGTRTRRTRARPQAEPTPPPTPAVEITPAEPPLPLSVPEPALAARVAPPPAERPVPSSRRAIFFDVENTSRAEHISRVLAHLAVDRADRRTEFFAVGNWRVIGHDTARLLARHGAQLVHSAPSVGVRDWSDLRIAVASGVWLASARPGDVIEIVSDDRAFDAVGDVSASLGVTFRRLSYRGLLGLPVAEAPEREAAVDGGQARHGVAARSRRGRRGRRHGRPEHVPRPTAPAHLTVAPPPPSAPAAAAEPHTAPHDEIVAVVRELAQAAGGRNVTLDTLANALKSRGFSRPPGSPRLITRLRRIKELEVSRSGVITLHDGAAAPRAEEPEPVAEPAEVPEVAVQPAPAEPEEEHEELEPAPGNDVRVSYSPRRDDDPRRRSRRGGRRRRGGRGGGGGGRPPMGDQRQPPPPRDFPPRDAAAREAAVREAFRTRTAPSYISGEPLA
jgi:hypothetical protein